MSNKELLAKWQKRLGLTDWKIELQDNCVPDEMELRDVEGCCNWQESIKVAKIQVLSESCYGKDRIVQYDFEKTLVHELLHIKFCLLDESGNPLQDRVLHQIIEDLAKAFVEKFSKKNENNANS